MWVACSRLKRPGRGLGLLIEFRAEPPMTSGCESADYERKAKTTNNRFVARPLPVFLLPLAHSVCDLRVLSAGQKRSLDTTPACTNFHHFLFIFRGDLCFGLYCLCY
jgi:hypothetical protein